MSGSSSYPLYHQHAELWPLVAPLESYRDEMVEWVELIAQEIGLRSSLELLDLGSGGGHHLFHLVKLWPGSVSGIANDLSLAMLARVEELLPGFERIAGDMTRLELNQRFPLITVHDSFCYLRSESQIGALFSTIASHLESEGVALVKVDALAGEFAGPYRYLTTFERPEQEVTLTHYEWDPDPNDSEIETVYLFLERRDGRLVSREERHRMGLFSRQKLRELWRASGLVGRWVELERWDPERPNPVMVLRHAFSSSANP